MTCRSPLLKTKQWTRRLFFLDFSHCGGQKIRVYVLLTQKSPFQPVFNLKHHRNHDKLVHASKNQTQPEIKNQPKLKSVFFYELLRYINN
jgi:hypothetical protein